MKCYNFQIQIIIKTRINKTKILQLVLILVIIKIFNIKKVTFINRNLVRFFFLQNLFEF